LLEMRERDEAICPGYILLVLQMPEVRTGKPCLKGKG